MGNYKGAEKEQENVDEDEALSLCDLPNKPEKQFKKESPAHGGGGGGEEDFDFCSWGGSLKESEMCAADEVFFQGQILPLRHSISSDSAAAAGIRCNSMDRYTTASSRSSSTRSHQSSSSAASSITTPNRPQDKHRRIRNQFQYSQPSPTPQLRFSKVPHGLAANNYPRNSTLWSLFRVGLVTTPEISSQSFRARNNDNNNRNKVVRSGSSGSSTVSNPDIKPNITQKLKQRFTDKNLVFFDTCKCSSNSVQTIPSTLSAKNQDQKKNIKKQTMSRIRTFEWLKQLSLEAEEGAATTTE